MLSPKHLRAIPDHGVTTECLTTPVHRCLFVSEILRLIFEFARLWDEDSRRGDADEDTIDSDENEHQSSDGKKVLASLAATCQSFSVVALDVLWRVLDGLDPLLTICPKPEASMDETDWSSFRKYAERVRCVQIWGRATRVPALVKQTLAASLERCPGDRLLIFPKLTKFDWRETVSSSSDDSGIPLFKYFTGPAVTTIALSFIRLQVPSTSEWAILSDLPNLCPNVTSFTSFFSCPRAYDPSQQIGEMASQWKRLRSLRSCAIPQFNMDKLTSQRTLETLGIEINISSPLHVDRVPNTVRELLLSPRDTSLCTRYLQNVHGSPKTCCLFIGMNIIDEAEIETLFCLLPLRLDTSRLKQLTIQPRSVFAKIPLSELPKLRTPLIPPLIQFSRLCELDMDLFCTSHLHDAEYARLAKSLAHLRHLKIGTAKLSSVIRSCPAASVAAVIAVVTYCPHLETLGIAFDGTIPPSPSLTHTAGNDERPRTVTDAESGDLVLEGCGVPNKRITKIHVGYSPIANATVGVLASCLKSLMPRLKEIQHHGLDERWSTVQDVLTNS